MEICSRCALRQATLFLTYVLEEAVSHRSLCASCAQTESENDVILQRILAETQDDELVKVVIDSRENGVTSTWIGEIPLVEETPSVSELEMWEIGAPAPLFSGQSFEEKSSQDAVPDEMALDPFDDDEDPFAETEEEFAEFASEHLGDDPFEDDFSDTKPVFAGISAFARCENCGTTWEKIKADGRCGCPLCYAAFNEQILGVMMRCQRSVSHIGKSPTWARKAKLRAQNEAKRQAKRLALLQKRLNEAVFAEKYEEAAQLRDKLKTLTNDD